MEKEKYVAPVAIISDIKTSTPFLQMDSGTAELPPDVTPESSVEPTQTF